MKKYAFLVPVSVAAAALSGNAAANLPSAESSANAQPPSVSKANKSSARMESFVLTRAPGGYLIAQHESHESHQSHDSHASHESHASHASHESHTSGGMHV